MVAMNPQTFEKDVASIDKGGYLFYDSTKPLPPSRLRDDITVIGVPLTAICNREYIDPRQRQLFKNIIYVGALSALLDMDVGAIEKLIAEQFRTKDTLIEPNVHALHLGRDYVTMNLEHPIGLKLKKSERGRRPHLHRRQQRGRARRGLWRRDRCAPGIRSRPPPRLPRRSSATVRATAPTATRRTATPSSRPRTSSPRSAW
jgi:hypothetical protein